MTDNPSPNVPPSHAWPAGQRLAGYELQAVVACRGAGILYRAWDHGLDMQVAVKEYLPARLAMRAADGQVVPADAASAAVFQRGLQAFVAEARTLARCDHPALVRVLQLLQSHGTAYRVMPWVPGRSLLDLRQSMATAPDETALRTLLDDLLGALETYHRVGGVHGNVGPSQILLRGDDRALLLGPSAAGRATASDAVEVLMRQFEPAFAAPEQSAPSAGNPLGPWTDLYAVAGVLRFCITGVLPSPAGGPAPAPLADAVAGSAPAAQPPRPYSAALLAALDAAASPAVADRPRSVADLRQRLQAGPGAAPGSGSLPFEAAAHPPAALGSPAATRADARTLRIIQQAIAGTGTAAAHPGAQPAAPRDPADHPFTDAGAPVGSGPVEAPAAAPPTPTPAQPARPATAGRAGARLRLGQWLVAALPVVALLAYAGWHLDRPQLQPVALQAPAGLAGSGPASAAAAPFGRLQAPTIGSTATAMLPATPAVQPMPIPIPMPTPPTAAARGDAMQVADTPPAKPSATVARQKAAARAARQARAAGPAAQCGKRGTAAHARCLQQQCRRAQWARHPQCTPQKQPAEKARRTVQKPSGQPPADGPMPRVAAISSPGATVRHP